MLFWEYVKNIVFYPWPPKFTYFSREKYIHLILITPHLKSFLHQFKSPKSSISSTLDMGETHGTIHSEANFFQPWACEIKQVPLCDVLMGTLVPPGYSLLWLWPYTFLPGPPGSPRYSLKSRWRLPWPIACTLLASAELAPCEYCQDLELAPSGAAAHAAPGHTWARAGVAKECCAGSRDLRECR